MIQVKRLAHATFRRPTSKVVVLADIAPNVLVARLSLPVNSVKGLID
jgi:hypothetical protein